jgi:hypothetical protein
MPDGSIGAAKSCMGTERPVQRPQDPEQQKGT